MNYVYTVTDLSDLSVLGKGLSFTPHFHEAIHFDSEDEAEAVANRLRASGVEVDVMEWDVERFERARQSSKQLLPGNSRR